MACHIGTWGWSYVYLCLCQTPYCHMPFVILQIRAGAKIGKLWFGCVVEEHATVCDVFSDFSAGTLDGNHPFQTSSALSMYRQLWGKPRVNKCE